MTAFLVVTAVLFVGAAVFNVVGSVRLHLLKRENEKRQLRLTSLEKRSALHTLRRESRSLLWDIERRRQTIAENGRRDARRDDQSVRWLSHRLGSARRDFEYRLATLNVRFEPLQVAGNVSRRDDGTYEVVSLPGLTQEQEHRVRSVIERANRYVTTARELLLNAERRGRELERALTEAEHAVGGTGAEALERAGAPEDRYRDVLREVVRVHSAPPPATPGPSSNMEDRWESSRNDLVDQAGQTLDHGFSDSPGVRQ
ncbi:hypothetical protein [Nocardiopsis sp. NPDC006938]|uniref:hypothetical protein n=1 Tax=Nocardiopsis sp. NPDC006938 TaxID=3364337 RepID=UPI00369E4214